MKNFATAMMKKEREDAKRAKTEKEYRFLAKGLAQNSREQNPLCDVIVRVQDVSFHGSRFVLGSSSPVLKRMFLSEKEPLSKIVSLKDISKEGFKVIWDFIYDERYGTDDERIALEVLKGAHFLQVELLCREYEEKVKKMLRPQNAFGILSVAKNLKLQSLEEAAMESISRRFQEVVRSQEFLSVSVETLEAFLDRDDLDVSSEIDVYEGVMRWVSRESSRKAHTPALLDRVRLPLLPLRYLHRHVIGDPEISRDPRCLALVMEAKDFHVPDLRVTVPAEKTKARGTGFYRHPHAFWCVGRYEDGAKILSVNPRDLSFRVVTRYPWNEEKCFGTAFSAANRKLFLAGVGVLKVYDLAKNAWETGPAPLEDVEWPASGVGLGSVFVCGGRSRAQRKLSRSASRFDLGSWKWIRVPDAKYERHAAAAVVLDSCLHVVGGYPNGKKFERLDTRTKTWSELTEWPGGLNSPGVTVHDGEIHVSGGGRGGQPKLPRVYVHDSRKNDWRLLPPMTEKRYRHGLVSFERILYAVGGEKTPSVETYDGASWKLATRLDVETCHRACLMEWTTE